MKELNIPIIFNYFVVVKWLQHLQQEKRLSQVKRN